MPTITVEASGVSGLTAACDENLQQCVARALSEAARQLGRPLDVLWVELSGTKAPLEDWQTRLVGNEDITVLAATPGTLLHRIYSLYAQLGRRLSVAERGQAEDRAPRLRHAVAQVLLIACGAQQLESERNCYQQMLTAQDSRLQQVAQGLGMTGAEFARQADSVVRLGMQQNQPTSLAALEAEVHELRGLITPALEQLCPKECRFLQAYDAVKAAFPQRFC